MKISCLQMNMRLGETEANFAHAGALIRAAAAAAPDVIVLPETWNTGFFPKEDLAARSDLDGSRVRAEIGGLAKELGVNIVAGSVSNIKQGRVYNTSYTFDRAGVCVNEYDKIHLFTPLGEPDYYAAGSQAPLFRLDGVACGLIICYDLRFPELARTLALQGAEVLFAVSQWPAVRASQAEILAKARAIENQAFLAYANSCGKAGETVFGGQSALIDPWGRALAQAGESEAIITADFDLSVIQKIRQSINVFQDRRPALYRVN